VFRPFVSIIVPCFNAEPWLAEALESALAQSWVEKELILVDDGSTDDSLRVATNFENRGVIVLRQENRGASAARNAAMRIAKGDFVQFLDADDVLAADKIARQIHALNKKGTANVAAGEWAHFENDWRFANFVPEAIWGDFQSVDWLVTSWGGGGMMHPAAWLTPREILDRAGAWNESISLDDDGEYFCRVLLASEGVHFVPKARSYYRRHAGKRLSGSRGLDAAKSAYLACQLRDSALLAHEDSARTRRAVAQLYYRFAWDHYPEGKSWVSNALARSRALDPDIRMAQGGSREQLMARCLGWKAARRLQKASLPFRRMLDEVVGGLRPE
jgi:glycosyltransferase involved in cell wall biosynthesis